jgi:hypothetical protein
MKNHTRATTSSSAAAFDDRPRAPALPADANGPAVLGCHDMSGLESVDAKPLLVYEKGH